MSTDSSNWIELTPVAQILREEFLDPAGITPYFLAKSIGVPQTYLTKAFQSGRIGDELAVLLDRFFETDPGFFSRLQADHDRRVAERKRAEHLKTVLSRSSDYQRWKVQCDPILQEIVAAGGTKHFDPNGSNHLLHNHLKHLLRAGLVEYLDEAEKVTYHITDLGRAAIDQQLREAA
jgi:plasmid maintenance system antidote protein VapI